VFRESSPPGADFTPTTTGPNSNPSTVDEPSVSNNGSYVVYTGNWYQSESADSGATWTYQDPNTAFPPINGQVFCCDQHTIYSPNGGPGGITIWQLLYSPDHTTGANTLRLAIADGQAGLQSGIWHTYDVTSTSLPPGASGWIDYPQLALTRTYLYLTFNTFLGGGTDPGCYSPSTVCNQTASLALRVALTDLGSSAPLSFGFFESPCTSFCVDTLSPVQQAGSTMYFGGHVAQAASASPDPSFLRIFEWPDSQAGASVAQHDVADPNGFVYMNGGDGNCVPPGGGPNICLRDDSRVKAGWLGSGELGFIWDAKQGTFGQTTAPYPYLRGAVINMTTNPWSLVGDIVQGYSDTAAIYPDVAINPRGGLGLTMTIGGGSFLPSAVIGILDDLSPTNQFELQTVGISANGPSQSEWGDFLTVRPASGSMTSWVATGYTMQGATAQPIFTWFGRQRDDPFVPQSLTCGAPITTTLGANTTANPIATFHGPSNWLGDYSASIDWGDGSAPFVAGLSGPVASATVFGNHAFTTAGTLTVTVTVSDGSGGTASCTLTATVAGSVYSTVSRAQYRLTNSDGIHWQDIDGTHLKLTVPIATTSNLAISGNVDLWTANAGYNQDVGIFINDGSPAGDRLVAWKESGGFAGTFSPNAAYVQTVMGSLAPGTYTIKLKWKTNKADPGTIFAAAGPGAPFSPTRLTARIVPTTIPMSYRASPPTGQYRLDGSDGTTWRDIDPGNLNFDFLAPSSGTAVIGANADLWTAMAGVNQDIGIFVGVDGAQDQLVAWKESGGFAGTNSPNAAFVQTTLTLVPGKAYMVTLKWKTNHVTTGPIRAGAGLGPFSPTTLIAQVLATGVVSEVSTLQYGLANSDGSTWQPIDGSKLALTIPSSTASRVATLSGNADLWTQNAGVNQDIGLIVNDGTTEQVVAWKESGGFAGTNSPNAAFVQTSLGLDPGKTYTVTLKWKTNHLTSGTIRAGAGLNPNFSPTTLTALIQPSS